MSAPAPAPGNSPGGIPGSIPGASPATGPGRTPGALAALPRAWGWAAAALLPLAVYVATLPVLLDLRDGAAQQHLLEREARAAAREVEGLLRRDIAQLSAVAGSRALARGDLAGFREEAAALLARNAAWHTVLLTEGEREVMNLRRPAEAAAVPAAGLPDILRTLGRAEAVVRPTGDGRLLLRVPAPAAGAPARTLAAVLEPAAFAGLLTEVAAPTGVQLLLRGPDGQALAGDPAVATAPGAGARVTLGDASLSVQAGGTARPGGAAFAWLLAAGALAAALASFLVALVGLRRVRGSRPRPRSSPARRRPSGGAPSCWRP